MTLGSKIAIIVIIFILAIIITTNIYEYFCKKTYEPLTTSIPDYIKHENEEYKLNSETTIDSPLANEGSLNSLTISFVLKFDADDDFEDNKILQYGPLKIYITKKSNGDCELFLRTGKDEPRILSKEINKETSVIMKNDENVMVSLLIHSNENNKGRKISVYRNGERIKDVYMRRTKFWQIYQYMAKIKPEHSIIVGDENKRNKKIKKTTIQYLFATPKILTNSEIQSLYKHYLNPSPTVIGGPAEPPPPTFEIRTRETDIPKATNQIITGISIVEEEKTKIKTGISK